MEIILHEQYCFENEDNEEFIKELEKDIKEFDKDAKWQSADTGRGVDWPVILTIYNTVSSTYSAVLTTICVIPIIKNLSKKFKEYFFKMENKYGELKICEDCAKLLALNYINEKESNIKNIKRVSKKTISINPPVRDKKTGHLDDNPDSYYFQMYHVTLDDKNEFGEFSEKYYSFIIKSDGRFELNHVLEIPQWNNF